MKASTVHTEDKIKGTKFLYSISYSIFVSVCKGNLPWGAGVLLIKLSN